MVPEGLRVSINKGAWPVLPIFDILRELGNISERDIYNTFNMGVGMVMAVSADIAEDVVEYLKQNNEPAYIIGSITEGEAGVDIC